MDVKQHATNLGDHQSHAQFGRSSGFSLVELLVVISVIVLLISIILPALGASRGAARNAICLSNLHQIGIAAVSYRNGHRNWMPTTLTNGTEAQMSLWDLRGQTQGAAESRTSADLLVEAGLTDKTNFQCPSHKNQEGYVDTPTTALSDNTLSYGTNGALDQDIDSLRGTGQSAQTYAGSIVEPDGQKPKYSVYQAWPFHLISRPSEGFYYADSRANPHVDKVGTIGISVLAYAYYYVQPPAEPDPLRTDLVAQQQSARHFGRTSVNLLYFDGAAKSKAGEDVFSYAYQEAVTQPDSLWRPWDVK